MQRGYCSVATRYSPGLVRQQAFSSPEASLKVVCGSSSLFSLGLSPPSCECRQAGVLLSDCSLSRGQVSRLQPGPELQRWISEAVHDMLCGCRWQQELWRCQGD